MRAVPPNSAAEAWLDEGRRNSSVLDAVGSAVIIGRDPEAAAWVALGLAQMQAGTRRVAVADLVGELAPLQALVDPTSDPHGISDSFLFGVSLNKIAQQADDAGNLFVLPSGSEAVAIDEVFRSDRWRRLASGFREVGALLLLVAHADTPGLDALASSVEGTIVVGDASGALADAAPPLAVIAPARRRPARGADLPTEELPASRTPRPPRVAGADADGESGGRNWRRIASLVLLLGIVAVALAYYLLPRVTGKQGDVPRTARRDSASQRPATTTTAPNDSAKHGPDTLAALTVANPGDSLGAAAYSVYVTGSNAAEGATLEPRDARELPLIALTPVLQDGAPFYRLFVGAYPTAAAAESLRTVMRRRALLGDSTGEIKRTPYALRVADNVPATEVAQRVADLAKRSIPVYPMSRGDGTVALYAGAFETPDQAAWLARALRAAGLTPTLVYRTGRSL